MRCPALPAAAVLIFVLAACGGDSDSTGASDMTTPDLARASKRLAAGQVESVLPLTPVTDLPEGIAVSRQGDIYVGDRRLEGNERISRILRIAPDDIVSVFA